MPSSPFVGEWKIEHWKHDSIQVPDGIPAGSFLVHGVLNITQPDQNVNSFTLQWPDESGNMVSVSGLRSNEAQTELSGKELHVNFGPTRGTVNCDLILTLHQTTSTITGTIRLPQEQDSGDPEIGHGTFTATSNAGGGNAEYTRRPT